MGYFYALSGALLFGANGSVTKVLMEAGLTPAQVTQFRVLGTAAIAGLVLSVVDRGGFRVSVRQFAVLAVLGTVGIAVLQASYAAAVQLLPVGIALLLEYLAVLGVAVIAFVFLAEPVRARLWLAIGLVLAGLAIVAEIWASDLHGVGVLMGLVAAGALTLYFLVGEHQVARMSPLAVSFWTMSVAALCWAPLSGWWTLDPGVFTRPVPVGGALGPVELPLAVPLAWNIVLGSFLPFLLSFLALRRLSATAAGVVASAEVIFAFLFAWLWLGETLDAAQVVGAGIVLAGIVLAQTSRNGGVVEADLALPDRSGPER